MENQSSQDGNINGVVGLIDQESNDFPLLDSCTFPESAQCEGIYGPGKGSYTFGT